VDSWAVPNARDQSNVGMNLAEQINMAHIFDEMLYVTFTLNRFDKVRGCTPGSEKSPNRCATAGAVLRDLADEAKPSGT
jgi:hypothetical protein